MNLFIKSFLIVTTFLILTSCNRPANEEQTEDVAEDINEEIIDEPAEDDAEFMVEAHTYSLMLRQYGKVAMEKENIPESVKEFAKTSVEFNENINNQLTQMSLGTKVILPSSLGENVLEFQEKLREKEGAEFAEEYIDVVGEIQSKMVSDYQNAFNRTRNSQLSEWIRVALPQINRREEKVDELAGLTDDLE